MSKLRITPDTLSYEIIPCVGNIVRIEEHLNALCGLEYKGLRVNALCVFTTAETWAMSETEFKRAYFNYVSLLDESPAAGKIIRRSKDDFEISPRVVCVFTTDSGVYFMHSNKQITSIKRELTIGHTP